jgi:hypothetical protein
MWLERDALDFTSLPEFVTIVMSLQMPFKALNIFICYGQFLHIFGLHSKEIEQR